MLLRALICALTMMFPILGADAAPDNTLGMALMSATVDGGDPPSLVRGAGVVSVHRTEAGRYVVGFNRDLSNCTCTASVGGNHVSFAFTTSSATANCPNTGNTLATVYLRTLANAATDVPFHLIVFCPK